MRWYENLTSFSQSSLNREVPPPNPWHLCVPACCSLCSFPHALCFKPWQGCIALYISTHLSGPASHLFPWDCLCLGQLDIKASLLEFACGALLSCLLPSDCLFLGLISQESELWCERCLHPFFLFLVLRIEPRALHKPSKFSTAEYLPLTPSLYFETLSCYVA